MLTLNSYMSKTPLAKVNLKDNKQKRNAKLIAQPESFDAGLHINKIGDKIFA